MTEIKHGEGKSSPFSKMPINKFRRSDGELHGTIIIVMIDVVKNHQWMLRPVYEVI